jgi:serine/threonine protein phosphatase PrpC
MPDNADESWVFSHNAESAGSEHMMGSSSLIYAVGAGSVCGKKSWSIRPSNEDSFYAVSSSRNTPLSVSPSGLFIVADGQGAYADGQEASRGAIQAMVDTIMPELATSSSMPPPEVCTALLAKAVQKANEAVNQKNIYLNGGRPGPYDEVGVSTTLTAAMLVGSTAYVANVGACRTYLYRAEEGLKQVTTDHRVVFRVIKDGILPPEALHTWVHRYMVDRALYNQPQVEVDLFTVPLQPGDVILLCSGGLWKEIGDSEIEAVIRSAPINPSLMAWILIQIALDRDARDDVSVIVVSVLEAQGRGAGPDM